MASDEPIEATSGGRSRPFTLDWEAHRWSSEVAYNMADFPFIAHVRGKRYELYGDGSFSGTFDEE